MLRVKLASFLSLPFLFYTTVYSFADESSLADLEAQMEKVQNARESIDYLKRERAMTMRQFGEKVHQLPSSDVGQFYTAEIELAEKEAEEGQRSLLRIARVVEISPPLFENLITRLDDHRHPHKRDTAREVYAVLLERGGGGDAAIWLIANHLRQFLTDGQQRLLLSQWLSSKNGGEKGGAPLPSHLHRIGDKGLPLCDQWGLLLWWKEDQNRLLSKFSRMSEHAKIGAFIDRFYELLGSPGILSEVVFGEEETKGGIFLIDALYLMMEQLKTDPHLYERVMEAYHVRFGVSIISDLLSERSGNDRDALRQVFSKNESAIELYLQKLFGEGKEEGPHYLRLLYTPRGRALLIDTIAILRDRGAHADAIVLLEALKNSDNTMDRRLFFYLVDSHWRLGEGKKSMELLNQHPELWKEESLPRVRQWYEKLYRTALNPPGDKQKNLQINPTPLTTTEFRLYEDNRFTVFYQRDLKSRFAAVLKAVSHDSPSHTYRRVFFEWGDSLSVSRGKLSLFLGQVQHPELLLKSLANAIALY